VRISEILLQNATWGCPTTGNDAKGQASKPFDPGAERIFGDVSILRGKW
jgi:hypothetical protein